MNFTRYVVSQIIHKRYSAFLIAGLTLGLLVILGSKGLLVGYLEYTKKKALQVDTHVMVELKTIEPEKLRTLAAEIASWDGVASIDFVSRYETESRTAGIFSEKLTSVHEEKVLWTGIFRDVQTREPETDLEKFVKILAKSSDKIGHNRWLVERLSADAELSGLNVDPVDFKGERVFADSPSIFRIIRAAPMLGDEIFVKNDRMSDEEPSANFTLLPKGYLLRMAGFLDMEQSERLNIVMDFSSLKKIMPKCGLNTVLIGLDDENDDQLYLKIKNLFGGMGTCVFWKDENKGVDSMLSSLQLMITLVTMIVIIVCCFGFYTTLHVTLTEKRRMVSLLKALGASSLIILFWFLFYGLLLYGIGVVFVGLLLCVLYPLAGRIPLGNLSELYKYINVDIYFDLQTAAVLVAILLCIIAACLIPAVNVVRNNIVDGLHSE